jgi:hypothetical protein
MRRGKETEKEENEDERRGRRRRRRRMRMRMWRRMRMRRIMRMRREGGKTVPSSFRIYGINRRCWRLILAFHKFNF